MKAGSYLALLVILLIDFTGMIILVSRSINYVIFEFFLLVLFLLLSAIIVVGVYKNKSWAWKVASLFFLLLLINLAFTYLQSWGIIVFSISSILAAVGFIISVSNMAAYRKLRLPPKPEKLEEPLEDVKDEVHVETYGAKETIKPGKYLASARGTVYHSPTCDWGKKITEPQWFDSEEEAKKKGFKPHSCLK